MTLGGSAKKKKNKDKEKKNTVYNYIKYGKYVYWDDDQPAGVGRVALAAQVHVDPAAAFPRSGQPGRLVAS